METKVISNDVGNLFFFCRNNNLNLEVVSIEGTEESEFRDGYSDKLNAEQVDSHDMGNCCFIIDGMANFKAVSRYKVEYVVDGKLEEDFISGSFLIGKRINQWCPTQELHFTKIVGFSSLEEMSNAYEQANIRISKLN